MPWFKTGATHDFQINVVQSIKGVGCLQELRCVVSQKKSNITVLLALVVNIKRADTFSRVIIIPGSKGIIRHFKLININW